MLSLNNYFHTLHKPKIIVVFSKTDSQNFVVEGHALAFCVNIRHL